MKEIMGFFINLIFKRFKVCENFIIFESGRNRVDDNPYAVYEYIKAHNITDFKYMWLVSRSTDVSMLKKGEYCFYKTFKSYYYMAIAKYFIRSQCLTSLLKKKKDQIYIYMTHGVYGLKKIGYDITGARDRKELDYVKPIDYYIAESDMGLKYFRSSSGYNGKALSLGLARSDKLFNIDEEKVNIIKKKLGIQDYSRKIVLYAPTFRDEDIKRNKMDYDVNFLSDIKNIYFIATVHPQAKKLVQNYKFDKNIINAIDYPDMNELLMISDVLITDYSSAVFEFSIKEKPVIFYPYDYDDYVKYRGNFYLNYKKDLPGPICYTKKKLYDTLENIDTIFEKYKTKIKKFNKKYNKMHDGYATKRFVDELLKGTFKK